MPGNKEEDSHEHTFTEGKCECGEEDPNYVPPVEGGEEVVSGGSADFDSLLPGENGNFSRHFLVLEFEPRSGLGAFDDLVDELHPADTVPDGRELALIRTAFQLGVDGVGKRLDGLERHLLDLAAALLGDRRLARHLVIEPCRVLDFKQHAPVILVHHVQRVVMAILSSAIWNPISMKFRHVKVDTPLITRLLLLLRVVMCLVISS